MNIVNSGEKFMVYGESVKTYKKLPANTYTVCFSPMSGFYLELHSDLAVKEKVYGTYHKKVTKVLNTFKNFDRNMGVILSGPKGVGKSMFARLLAEQSKQEGIPLLIVSEAFEGLSNFISSIEQECIVLFDEFDKTYTDGNDDSPQEELLSLFDGIDSGKKLYVITCNEVRKLNDYLLNRPGRFHYHFIMDTPNSAEIQEYLDDNLVDEAKQYISKIIALSEMSQFTYDVLRAIVFELNQGYDLKETLSDLNIEKESNVTLKVDITFNNGVTLTSHDALEINLLEASYGDDLDYNWCYFTKGTFPKEVERYLKEVRIGIKKSEIKEGTDFKYHVDPSTVDIRWEDYDDECPKNVAKAIQKIQDTMKVTNVTITKLGTFTNSKALKYLF